MKPMNHNWSATIKDSQNSTEVNVFPKVTVNDVEVNWIVYENLHKSDIKRTSGARQFFLFRVCRFTHRQQHAFDLAKGSKATEEGQQTNQRRGDNEDINSTRKQVRAKQFAEEITIDEGYETQYKDNNTAKLCRNREKKS